jgi:hypothetical protein
MARLFQAKCAFVFLGCFSILLGCGDDIDTTSVTGNVTYQGKPLANGSVTFHPEKGHPVAAVIDTSGDYAVDLPPGDYRVAVNAPGIELPEGRREGEFPSPAPPKLVLPPEYSQWAKTTLQVTVNESGDPQTADFALK